MREHRQASVEPLPELCTPPRSGSMLPPFLTVLDCEDAAGAGACDMTTPLTDKSQGSIPTHHPIALREHYGLVAVDAPFTPASRFMMPPTLTGGGSVVAVSPLPGGPLDMDIASEPNTANGTPHHRADDSANRSFQLRLPADSSLQLSSDDFDISDDLAGIDRHDSPKRGQGRTAQVFLGVRRSDGLPVAVKRIKAGFFDEINREMYCMEASQEHTTGLVRSMGYFQDHDNLSVSLVMERMTGSLAAFRGAPLPEAAAVAALAMVIRGLHTLHHDLRIVHRDIKPGNLLFNAEAGVKIGDFGLAAQLADTPSTQLFVGSIMYMAPERLRGEPYSFVSDMWSAGMVAAELLLGRHPLASAFPTPDPEREASAEATFWAVAEVLQHADGDDEKPELAVRRHVLDVLAERGVSRPTIALLGAMLCRAQARITSTQALRLVSSMQSFDEYVADFARFMQQDPLV